MMSWRLQKAYFIDLFCVLLNRGCFLHLPHLSETRTWKGRNSYHWLVNKKTKQKKRQKPNQTTTKKRRKKLQPANLENICKGGVYIWQGIFWQKAFFGETLICWTGNVPRELISFHQIFQQKQHNFVLRAAGEPATRGGECGASRLFPWLYVWNI